MSSPQLPISYAAAAASALNTALRPGVKQPRKKDDDGDGNPIQKDQVLLPSQPSNNTEVEVANILTGANVDVPQQTTQSHSASPTSTSASVESDGDDSHMSFASQTSSSGKSALEKIIKNAVVKDRSASPHPLLSSWGGVTSTPKPPQGFNPLASIGTASSGPLRPKLSLRNPRVSRFFPPQRNGDTSSSESPFLPDGLTGGSVTAMSDFNIQRQKLEEEINSYVTGYYASPGHTMFPSRSVGNAHPNEYVAPAQSAMGSLRLAASKNAVDSSQAPVTTLGYKERTNFIGNPVLSGHEPHGASLPQSTQTTPTPHNSRAAPFVPRHSTTLEILEQAAGENEEQRSLTVTRPRSSWDQVPNWRIRGSGQKRVRDEGPRGPDTGFSSEEPYRLHWFDLQAAPSARGGMDQDTQPPSAGPLCPSDPHQVLPLSSSQNLTLSHSPSSAHGAIGKRGTPRPFEPFRPMNAVLNPDAYKQPMSEKEIAFREENGISLNYLGNHENPRNISADIPNRENCAVWIMNLPATCTHTDLLQALMPHRPGRIWATHINPPVQPRHQGAAAKVVFYHPSEAKRLLSLARDPGINVHEWPISAVYNKQRVAAQDCTKPTSRVLEIRGDKTLVNEDFLRSLFESHFVFEDEAVEVLAEVENIRVIQWRFGSMRAQAGSAYRLLKRMYPCIDVRYAIDPCAQEMGIPPGEEVNRRLGPGQGASASQSAFGAPGGSGTMPWNAYN